MSGTISAGLVNVQNLSVTNGASTVKANNLDFANFTVPQNLDVSGNFSLGGLNFYEGNYKAGDIISYNLKGTMTISDASAYFNSNVSIGVPSAADNRIYVPDTTLDIDFYEMIYWGVDSRSNNTVRMSATVCVPSTIVSTTIVSYKHGTLGTTFQNFTLWQTMQDITQGTINATYPDLTAWILATTGYVTVCADNPGYGVSVGNYNFFVPTGESYSQYNAVVALKQLIQQKPTLFNGPSFVAPIDVISTGYSLGGNFCPLVSELIALNTVDFNLVNTIPGAPVNSYEVFDNAWYGDSSGQTLSDNNTGLNVLYFTLLTANNNNSIIGPLLNFKPEITYGVMPIFEQLYLDSPKAKEILASPYGGIPTMIRYTQNATGGRGIVDASGLSYNYLEFDPINNPAYVVQSEILTDAANNNLINLKQGPFFTNIFEDFSDLSGTPINVMYSLQDELICYDASNVYIGNFLKDNVTGPLHTFLTTDNAGNGGFNGLSRTPFSDDDEFVLQIDLDSQMNGAAAALVSSENTNSCSNRRWNTLPLGLNLQNHDFYQYRIFQTVVRRYLLARST